MIAGATAHREQQLGDEMLHTGALTISSFSRDG